MAPQTVRASPRHRAPISALIRDSDRKLAAGRHGGHRMVPLASRLFPPRPRRAVPGQGHDPILLGGIRGYAAWAASSWGQNIEPFNGIDLFGGWATTNVTGLAKGTSLNQVLLPVGSSGAAPTVNTATHVKGGYAFGVGFDISVFLSSRLAKRKGRHCHNTQMDHHTRWDPGGRSPYRLHV